MEHRFQINLRGIISLLSDHLYSRPEVFLRELLQNAVDAITARQQREPSHQGEITLTLLTAKGKQPTLEVTENGVGLTLDEVHRFLATIGESSKRDSTGKRTGDYLGQFGIGLLSCFIVSDEIVVVTRSVKGGSAVEWRGKQDGTYTVRELPGDLAPGTQVYLTCRPGREELFEPDEIKRLAVHYGGLLLYPVQFSTGRATTVLNDKPPPWRAKFRGDKERRQALLRYGNQAFDEQFLDAIPLLSTTAGIDGTAYVLPRPANPAAKQIHRVYLRNMFLGEAGDQLLPEWAVFVKAIVNVTHLRPTASRESFYEDEMLEAARIELGNCLREYMLAMPEKDPKRFSQFMSVHQLSIKALAAADEQCFAVFADWLPFETNSGRLTLRELRNTGEPIEYVDDVSQFHQIAKLASAAGRLVVNAGYAYEAELLSRVSSHFEGTEVRKIEADSFARDFTELNEAEQDQIHALADAADQVLRPLGCRADFRKFEPTDVPVLFCIGDEGRFLRSLNQTQEIADPLYAGVLKSIASGRQTPTDTVCYFNYANSLIAKLAEVTVPRLLLRSVEILYVQGLLLAQQPLSSKELGILNKGLSGLIGVVADRAEGG